MKLHEIITALEDHTQSVLIEKMVPYKKSLLAYFSSRFTSEPVLMVTSVTNACQYARIEPAGELNDAICAYLDDYDCDNEDSENFSEYETICANSIMLKDL
jgi:hypothetical protein